MTHLPAIVVHGGAWSIPDDWVARSREGVRQAAIRGFRVMYNGGSAVDGAMCAVMMMEDNPVFDCGTGSVLTSARQVEMDAVMMDGKDLRTGAVACVRNIKNPVKLAKLVMQKTDHTLLVGTGADEFAAEQGVPKVATEQLVTPEAIQEFERVMVFKEAVNKGFNPRPLGGAEGGAAGHDTVGAVTVDKNGHVACATSTGGITAKRPGRVGDSPIVGSGAYADDESGAASTTGHGEAISKVCLAHTVAQLLKEGRTPQQAAEEALRHMTRRVNGSGGVIVLTPSGQMGHASTTQRMAWASMANHVLHSGVEPDEDVEQTIEDPGDVQRRERRTECWECPDTLARVQPTPPPARPSP